jgi:hypothetical protein
MQGLRPNAQGVGIRDQGSGIRKERSIAWLVLSLRSFYHPASRDSFKTFKSMETSTPCTLHPCQLPAASCLLAPASSRLASPHFTCSNCLNASAIERATTSWNDGFGNSWASGG